MIFCFPLSFYFAATAARDDFFFFCSSSVTMSEMLITAHWHERHLEIFFWVNRRHAKHLRKKFIWLAKVFFFKRKKFKANDQKLRKLSTWFLLIFLQLFHIFFKSFQVKKLQITKNHGKFIKMGFKKSMKINEICGNYLINSIYFLQYFPLSLIQLNLKLQIKWLKIMENLFKLKISQIKHWGLNSFIFMQITFPNFF